MQPDAARHREIGNPMPNTTLRRMTYRGRHRATRFTIPVADVIAEAQRIPIAEVFAMRDEIWARRA